VPELASEIEVSAATIYTRKSKYGGMNVSDAQKLKGLEDENPRLKHLVADLSLDKEVLKAVIQKKRPELAGMRKDVAFASERFPVSERRARKLLGTDRGSYR